MSQKYEIVKTGFNVWEVRDRDGITIFEGSEQECKNYIQEERRMRRRF